MECKAEAEGISVKQVGSAYTSTRCAKCGFTADENRATRNDFRCVKCGLKANADYSGSEAKAHPFRAVSYPQIDPVS